jgi:hypothetical protein
LNTWPARIQINSPIDDSISVLSDHIITQVLFSSLPLPTRNALLHNRNVSNAWQLNSSRKSQVFLEAESTTFYWGCGKAKRDGRGREKISIQAIWDKIKTWQ